jgi:ESS family glutamate:Na+ symporter
LTRLAPPGAGAILWGFFFLFGLVVAIIMRRLIALSPFGRLTDPELQRRITGMSVDYLIVATGCGIELLVVWQYALPIGLMSLSAGILTTLAVVILGKRLSDYSLERTIAMYGVVTGTVSSGLLLARIVDPEFKTPVARELGFMNIFAVPVVGGLTFLLNAPLWWAWGLGSTCLVLLAVFLLSVAIL